MNSDGFMKQKTRMNFKNLRYLSFSHSVAEDSKLKGKVIPLQARCGPEGGYRYSSTLP